jgi:hypothetical protein
VEPIMAVTDMIFLAIVIAAFVEFGIVLAYANATTSGRR